MAEKPKSFEEFYFEPRKEILDIDEVINCAEKNDGEIGKYEGNMFCPECQRAKLFFVNKSSTRRAHLKKYPSENHAEECSYNYDYASKRIIKKFIDSLNYNQIQDRLNSIMKMLNRKQVTSGESSTGGGTSVHKKNNPMLIVEERENTVYKALRRKKLNAWIDESDGQELCVFYGKVKLKVDERIKKCDEVEIETLVTPDIARDKYYLLQIYTKNKKGEWKFRTNIYRGKKKDIVDESKVYNIVLIGNLDFNYKPFTIRLANWDALRYQETEE